jgi:hypothetical protein
MTRPTCEVAKWRTNTLERPAPKCGRPAAWFIEDGDTEFYACDEHSRQVLLQSDTATAEREPTAEKRADESDDELGRERGEAFDAWADRSHP